MNQKMEHFEDLPIWQKARQLSNAVYDLFEKGPGAKDFGFKDQIQRAAVSIMNNIAEGFERETNNDFAKFLTYAKGSSGEVRSMFYLAEDRGYISPESAAEQRDFAREISRGISALAKHLRATSQP